MQNTVRVSLFAPHLSGKLDRWRLGWRAAVVRPLFHLIYYTLIYLSLHQGHYSRFEEKVYRQPERAVRNGTGAESRGQ